MGRLSDILNGSSGGFNDVWNSTQAAGDFGPVPRGEYECHVTRGELESSRTKGTPGYKVEFSILDGEFRGRKLWLDCWLTPNGTYFSSVTRRVSEGNAGKCRFRSPSLTRRVAKVSAIGLTPAALAQSKRDLGKLGITTPEMMEQPLPRGIRCKVQAVVRRDDDGIERNRVRSFEVIGRDEPEADAFAPMPPAGVDPTGGVDVSSDVPF